MVPAGLTLLQWLAPPPSPRVYGRHELDSEDSENKQAWSGGGVGGSERSGRGYDGNT